MKKFIAAATRKNINGKLPYIWFHKYANGDFVLFDTEKEAVEFAEKRCADSSFSLQNPRAIEYSKQ